MQWLLECRRALRHGIKESCAAIFFVTPITAMKSFWQLR
jgi:hypothetical protein